MPWLDAYITATSLRLLVIPAVITFVDGAMLRINDWLRRKRRGV